MIKFLKICSIELLVKFYFSIFKAHLLIAELLKLIDKTELTEEIKLINDNIIKGFEGNEMLATQRTKAQNILEYKTKELFSQLEGQELSEEANEIISKIKELSLELNDHKRIYNEVIQESMKVFNISPVAFYKEYLSKNNK